HSLSAGQGREASLRAHAQRVRAGLSAHDRLSARAAPAPRRHDARSRGAPAVSGRRHPGLNDMRRGKPELLVATLILLLLASYIGYTQRVVTNLRADARRTSAMY